MNSAAKPDKEFEPFLHAVIHEDSQGPALTMLSALARRDLDPWDAAARLADLDPEAAIVELGALLHSLPPAQRPTEAMAAARLQALLPRNRAVAGSTQPPSVKSAWHPLRQAPPGLAAAEVSPRSNFSYLLVYLVFVAILIGSEWLNASGEGLPASTAEHALAPDGAPPRNPAGRPAERAAPAPADAARSP
jgi:hypothetical protein